MVFQVRARVIDRPGREDWATGVGGAWIVDLVTFAYGTSARDESGWAIAYRRERPTAMWTVWRRMRTGLVGTP